MRLPRGVSAWFALLVVAAVARCPAQATLGERVAAAERLIEQHELEAATLALWGVQRELDPDDDDLVTGALRSAVARLLGRADPLAAERSAVFTAIAGDLLALGRAYQRKRWYATALDLLDVAREFDPAVVAAARQWIGQRLAAAGEPEAAATEPEPGPTDWLTELGAARQFEYGEWTFVDGVARASAPADQTVLIVGRRVVHADHRISVRIDVDGDGNGALLFGVASVFDYFMVEYHQVASAGLGQVLLYRFQTDRPGVNQPVITLGQTDFALAPADLEGAVTLEVEVRGREALCRVRGKPELRKTLDREAHGMAGLGVFGRRDGAPAVTFAELRIDPLPEPAPAAATRTAEQELVDALEPVDGEEPEAAFRRLRALRADLEGIASAAVRAELRRALVARIEALDPLLPDRRDASARIAGRWITLADRYLANERPDCAVALLRESQRFDREAAAPRLAELLAKLEVQPEPERPADNAALVAAFAGGRPLLGSDPWTIDAAGAVAPRPAAGHVVACATERGTAERGAASVQVELSGEGAMAGLVFGVRNSNDLWVLAWRPSAVERSVELLRYRDGWRSIATQDVRFSAAAGAGWTTLRVRYGDGAIEVGVGAAAPIRIVTEERIAGRFGLLLGRADAPAAARFRSFTAEGLARD